MSGAFKGVAARILAIKPLAYYTHCSAHCLNFYFRDSPKRQTTFQANLLENSRYERLKNLCETRWPNRFNSLNVFLTDIGTVFTAFFH